MRIGIDIRSTLKKKTGTGYHTLNFINHLAKIDKKNSYFLYSKISPFNKGKKLPSLPGINFKHLINRFNINPAFFLRKLDIFHTTSLQFSKPKNTKIALLIHGVIHKAYPAAISTSTIKEKEDNFKFALPQADRIIVSSNTTKKDLLRFYKVHENKISVIYPGISKDLLTENDLSVIEKEEFFKKYNISKPFILYVGALEPRKNVEGLIKAFSILRDKHGVDCQLVIAGAKSWGIENITSQANKSLFKKDIIFTGYVRRQDLKALYQNTCVFAFPSFYEGVGLPVLEAFLFKIPVVTSKVSALGEVAGQAALLIDPYSPEDIAQGIYRAIDDSDIRKSLIDKGLDRLRHFSWEESAMRTLQVFNNCTN